MMAWFNASMFELPVLIPVGRGMEVLTARLDDVELLATELDEALDEVEVGVALEVVEVVDGAAEVVGGGGGGDQVDVGEGGGLQVEEGGGGGVELEEGAPPPEPPPNHQSP